MSEEIFYKKVGRRYVPVSYYDDNVLDAVPEGVHLLIKNKRSNMRLFNVDPAFAPLVAAGVYAKDKISASIMKASELRVPKDKQPLTKEQHEAWQQLAKSFGQETIALEWPSYAESAQAGVNAMQKEAEKLLTHPSVRSAYDHFLLMCKLTYDEKNT